MIEKRLKVMNPLGLHLRPASDLCTRAMEFDSEITIRFRDREFNAKSLLSVLSACVQSEDEISLVFDGPDEEAAAQKLTEYIQDLH